MAGTALISPSVDCVRTAIGFQHRLLIIFPQIQLRMSPTTGDSKPPANIASDNSSTRADRPPSGSPTGNRASFECWRMTPGSITSQAIQ